MTKGHPKNQIRRYRMKRGLSQKDVARLLGINQAHVSHWERGDQLPNLVNALKLSAVLGDCFVEILFGELYGKLRKEIWKRKKKLNISLLYE